MVILMIGGGLVLVATTGSASDAAHAPRASATPATGALPGFGTSALWSVAADRAVATADGSHALTVSGTQATVLDVRSGKTLSAMKVVPGLVPIAAGDVLLVRSGDSVLAWAGAASQPVTVPAGPSAFVLVRSGAAFVIDGASATVLTATGPVQAQAPRAGMVPLAYTDATQTVMWASATGHVVTGAVTGAVVGDVALAAPTPDAKITDWIAAGKKFAAIAWSTPSGTVLALHQLSDGAVASQRPLSAEPVMSADGASLAMPGAVLSLGSGNVAPADGFQPASFLSGDVVYGAMSDGHPALWSDGKVTKVAAGGWSLIARTQTGLLTLQSSRLNLFAPVKK